MPIYIYNIKGEDCEMVIFWKNYVIAYDKKNIPA